jgi:hypothetical protein
MQFDEPNWFAELKRFCDTYNIPINHLHEVLKDPKVIPMIRGKAFEFTVLSTLQHILTNRFQVTKKMVNPQLGYHDEDVAVIDMQQNHRFIVECKLAKKGSYTYFPKQKLHRIEVKCMRSRTLGKEMQERLAPILGVSVDQLGIHNDQYRIADFDIVITSIGNSFYETDENGLFIWKPSIEGEQFLQGLGYQDGDIQNFAFNKLYIARSQDLVPQSATNNGEGIKCSRAKCQNQYDCGFIPNYPKIFFSDNSLKPNAPWYDIKDAESLFSSSTPYSQSGN